MRPFRLIALLFVCTLVLAGPSSATACSTEADTEQGSAVNAVQYAETVVHWHQVRKVDAAASDDDIVFSKHDAASRELDAARALLEAGDWQGALKHAYRVPEILHY
jgi:hypothetical protein